MDSLPALKPLHGHLWASTKLSGAFGGFGPRPAMFVVQHVPERPVGAFPAGRGNVERLAGGQFHARRHEVKLDPPAFRVPVAHPCDVILLGVHASEGKIFERIHDLALIGLCRGVFRREGYDPGRISPLTVDAVDQLLRAPRVTAQHFWRHMLTSSTADRVFDRSPPAAMTARKKLNQHRKTSHAPLVRRQAHGRFRSAVPTALPLAPVPAGSRHEQSG